MSTDHLLVKKAFIYASRDIKNPENCEYNTRLGAWMWGNKFLVKSNNSNHLRVGTKKGDIETGEDQKGE